MNVFNTSEAIGQIKCAPKARILAVKKEIL